MFTIYKPLQEALELVSTGKKDGRSKQLLSNYNSYRKTCEAKKFIQDTLKQVEKEGWLITPNIFPYDLLLKDFPAFKHEVFWYTKIHKGEAYDLINILYEGCDIAMAENESHTKSILEINHIHVFSRKRTTEREELGKEFLDSSVYEKFLKNLSKNVYFGI